MTSTGPNPNPNPKPTSTSTITSFDKYKTYVSYDTKEKNTTIGHDEILKKMKQEQEKYDKARNTNNNVEGGAAIRRINHIGFVERVNNDNSESSSNNNNNNGSCYRNSSTNMSPSSNRSTRSIVSDTYSDGTVMYFKESIADKIRTSKEENDNDLEDIIMEEMAAKGMLLIQLGSFRERERLPLSEDVYAFIIACPVWSAPFWFATYFITIKYIIYGILLSDIRNDKSYDAGLPLVQYVKFFLIPVAVTMQDDLMTVYANAANKKYDATVMKATRHATRTKVIIATVARLFDGLLSLGVNFGVMLMTNTILNVFLNFAALHFLQYIDNIFYELVDRGFFGDSMEYATTLCKEISFPRRVAHDTNSHDEIEYTDTERDRNSKPTNQSWNNFLTSMDTILMCSTGLVCIIIYAIVQGCIYKDYPNGVFPVGIPSQMPSIMPSSYFADPLLEDIANSLP